MNDGGKMIGFKFVIPSAFPLHPPTPFLDEEINQSVIEIFDYVEANNVLNFAYLSDWRGMFNQNPAKYTLQNLLIQVNMLYSQAPPISFIDEVYLHKYLDLV